MRRLTLLLFLIPFWLLAGCSGDDNDGANSPAPPAATQAAEVLNQPLVTQAVPAPTQPAATQAASSEAAVKGSVTVDFTGSPEELEAIVEAFEVEPGTTAWDAIKAAIGEENLTFQDFGGALGVFITGFNGVEVEGNHFWEFKINGETSNVGVSAYVVQQGDVLEFVYSSF